MNNFYDQNSPIEAMVIAEPYYPDSSYYQENNTSNTITVTGSVVSGSNTTQHTTVFSNLQPISQQYQHPPIPPFQSPLLTPTFLEPSTQPLAESIILFENERYSPISGWSAKGLLPNDRKTISTGTGNSSWINLQEAETAFLSYGWRWRENSQWEVDINNAYHTASGGWLYSTDFASFKDSNSGSSTKGMGHFVRRRRYCRELVFNANFINNTGEVLTCDHCDLTEVDKLSSSMLTFFVTLSLLMYPGTFRVEKVSKVKNLLLESLEVTPGRRANQYSYNEVMSKLNGLCSRMPQKSSLFQTMESVSVRTKNAAILFTDAERRNLVRYLIRKTDYSHQYHCPQQQCGANCVFAAYGCPNGCLERFSQKWLPGHDAVCPYKIVPCSSMCGDGVRRMDQQRHLQFNCMLRLVQCDYFDMGCTNPIICRDLPFHCRDCVPQHLLMSSNKLVELKLENVRKQSDIIILTQQEVAAARAYHARHAPSSSD